MTDDDPFMDALVDALSQPVPHVGDQVMVNGRPGLLIDVRALTTCAVWYDIDHEGDFVQYCVADFRPRGTNPVIELVQRSIPRSEERPDVDSAPRP